MSRALLLVAAGALALAGCKPEPAAESASAPAALPAAAPKAGEWAFGMGRNSVEMVHLPTGDPARPDLRMVCALGDGFLILMPEFKPVASEERLTVGADGEAETLVAVAAARRGVQATGPIAEPLLKIIEGGAPLGVNHGSQNAGPFDPPPPAMRRAFTDTCRKLSTQGQI